MNPPERKAALRRELLAKRAVLSGRLEKDEAMFRQVLALPQYRRAGRVFLYVSTPREPDTGRLLRAALEAGKEVFAPVCAPEGGAMAFYRVESEACLRPGRFGILEPDPAAGGPACFPEGQDAEETLVVVPGVAFDLRGFRLGYGKGYYDRFLAGVDRNTVGLCYRELFLPELPAEEHDQRVRRVVTEAGCTACR